MVGRDGGTKRLPAGRLPTGRSIPVCSGRLEASRPLLGGPEFGADQGASSLVAGVPRPQSNTNLNTLYDYNIATKVPMANNITTWRLDMSSAPGVVDHRAGIHRG